MPKIGLISDSHGRHQRTQRAATLLIREGAQILLHLGDVGDIRVMDALINPSATLVSESAQHDCHAQPIIPTRLVFGNTDHDKASLARYARSVGLIVDDPVGNLELGTKRLVFTHGHETKPMTDAMEQQVDYLCHGHTHQRRDEHVGPTRVINPGALHRAREHTVALLDTEADQLTFYSVGKA